MKTQNTKYNAKSIMKKLRQTKTIKHHKGGALSMPANKTNNKDNIFKRSITYLNENKLNNIRELLNKIFEKKQQNFNMNISLQDPFFNIPTLIDNFNPEYYLKWYIKRNPTYVDWSKLGNIDTKDLKVDGFDTTKLEELYNGGSIYETVLAQICRDLLIMLLDEKHNLDNNVRELLTINKVKEKINKLTDKSSSLEPLKQFSQFSFALQQTKDILNKTSTYHDYLTSLSSTNNKNNNNTKIKKLQKQKTNLTYNTSELEKTKIIELLSKLNECIPKYDYKDIIIIVIEFIGFMSNDEMLDYDKRLLNTPYLLFPTYTPMTFQNALLISGTPIINFRLTNRIRQIHHTFDSPKADFRHDVEGHASLTHDFHNPIINTTKIISINTIITVLYPYFKNNYSKTKREHTNNPEELQKIIMSMILFAIFHPTMASAEFYYNFFSNILNEMKADKNTELSKKFKLDFITNITDISKVDNFNKVYPNFEDLNLSDKFDELVKIFIDNKDSLIAPITKIAKNPY